MVFPVELPLKKEWIIDNSLAESEYPMFEFRLFYQGLLLGSDRDNSRSPHKQEIRRYFHKQLVNLWNTRYPLRHQAEHGLERLGTNFRIGEKRILPIATQDNCLVCGVDILLLRRDFGPIVNSGDLDNRIKTVFDALRIPKTDEDSSGPENPLCVVMEDDKLVSELRVTADYLLGDPEQLIHDPIISSFNGDAKIAKTHALVIIHISMKATRAVPGNMEFV